MAELLVGAATVGGLVVGGPITWAAAFAALQTVAPALEKLISMYNASLENPDYCKRLITQCMLFRVYTHGLEKMSDVAFAPGVLESVASMRETIQNCHEFVETYGLPGWQGRVSDAASSLSIQETFSQLSDQLDKANAVLSTGLVLTTIQQNADAAAQIAALRSESAANRIEQMNIFKMLLSFMEKLGLQLPHEQVFLTVTPTSTAACPSPMFNLDISSLVKIAEGKFSVVYKGYYSGKPYAIKCFKHKDEWIDADIRTLKREARIMQHVDHPNIIKFQAFSLEAGIIVSELATFSIYEALFVKLKSFPLSERVGWVADVAKALRYLHERNIIHRDINTKNVLLVVDEHGHAVAKVTDFGVALAAGLQSTRGRSLTSIEISASTRCMAPELMDFDEDRPPYSSASDMFALGVLANVILTKDAPYAEVKTIEQLEATVLKGGRPLAFRPMSEEEDRLTRGLVDLIGDAQRGLWAAVPTARPSAGDIVKVLE